MGWMILILIAEIFSLYLLSHRLINQIFQTFHMLFHSRSVAVSFITALLFPGTVIHELSHLFTAEILGVRTGKLHLAPESIAGDDINVGSVEFAHTDPFRRSAIGLAPFFVGLIGLIGLAAILPNFWKDTVIAFQNNTLFSSPHSYFLLLTSYFLFCISNTMFASPEDMKGVIPLAVVLGLLVTSGYIAGFRVGITGALAENILQILSSIIKSLSVVILINLILYFLTSSIIWLLQKALGKVAKN